MIYAALAFAAALLLGAVLGCLAPRVRSRDLRVRGRSVEFVDVGAFGVEISPPRARFVLDVARRPDGSREVVERSEFALAPYVDAVYVSRLPEET